MYNRCTVFQIRTETFSISLSILYSGGWYTIFFCIVTRHSLLNLNFVFLTQLFQNVLGYFYFWPNCFRMYWVIFVFDPTVSEFMGLFLFLTLLFQNLWGYFCFWLNCFRIYGVIFVFDPTVSEFMGLFLFLTQLFQNLWGYFCFWPNCFRIYWVIYLLLTVHTCTY